MVKTPLNASHEIDSLLSKLLRPLDRLPLEDLEAVVWLDWAWGQGAPLLCQLLGHGPHVLTLKPAAAADHAHPELVGGARVPGRLPARDLPGLHRYRVFIIMWEASLISGHHRGTQAEWSTRICPRQESCSPGAGPSCGHSDLEHGDHHEHILCQGWHFVLTCLVQSSLHRCQCLNALEGIKQTVDSYNLGSGSGHPHCALLGTGVLINNHHTPSSSPLTWSHLPIPAGPHAHRGGHWLVIAQRQLYGPLHLLDVVEVLHDDQVDVVVYEHLQPLIELPVDLRLAQPVPVGRSLHDAPGHDGAPLVSTPPGDVTAGLVDLLTLEHIITCQVSISESHSLLGCSPPACPRLCCSRWRSGWCLPPPRRTPPPGPPPPPGAPLSSPECSSQPGDGESLTKYEVWCPTFT